MAESKVQAECSRFIAALRRRQLVASQDIARRTLEIMRLLVSTATVKDVSSLIISIKQAGALLVAAQPHELTIGNMVSAPQPRRALPQSLTRIVCPAGAPGPGDCT